MNERCVRAYASLKKSGKTLYSRTSFLFIRMAEGRANIHEFTRMIFIFAIRMHSASSLTSVNASVSNRSRRSLDDF